MAAAFPRYRGDNLPAQEILPSYFLITGACGECVAAGDRPQLACPAWRCRRITGTLRYQPECVPLGLSTNQSLDERPSFQSAHVSMRFTHGGYCDRATAGGSGDPD